LPSYDVIVAIISTENQVKATIMVKKSTPRKAVKDVGGRPRRDPDSLRTERLVLRIHPDLMAELTDLAQRERFTRSTLIEGALIILVNAAAADAGELVKLDLAGRYLNHDLPPSPRRSLSSFAHLLGGMRGSPPIQNAQPP
jgi:hypothetical protein